MKLISYQGTQSGLHGLGNMAIRFRLNGPYSHTEIMFEPSDNVDNYLPDGTSAPIDNSYWCVSSTGFDKLPYTSTVRPGCIGGVRFKRINPFTEKWDITNLDTQIFDPLVAVKIAKELEGRLYDYQLILGFVAWFIPNNKNRYMCSEINATMLGFRDAWRIDPCLLTYVIKNFEKA